MHMEGLFLAFSSFVALGMGKAYLLAQMPVVEDSGWFEKITGPFGALVFALVVVYVVYKALQAQQKKNEKLQGDLLAEKDKHIKELRSEIDFLQRQLNEREN